MTEKPGRQMSDAFLTAALVSVSGGLQDAYTYILRGQVFANAQTGNIVLLSHNLFQGDYRLALRYLVPLLAFAAGVAAAEGIRYRLRGERLHWRQKVLFGEIVLLLIVGFLPGRLDLPANALVSFSCAMQVQAFRKVDGYAFASTMCIGNMRSGMEALCAWRRTGDRVLLRKAGEYLAIILLFALGAGMGGLLAPALGRGTIWISCGLLAAGFGLLFRRPEKT